MSESKIEIKIGEVQFSGEGDKEKETRQALFRINLVTIAVVVQSDKTF